MRSGGRRRYTYGTGHLSTSSQCWIRIYCPARHVNHWAAVTVLDGGCAVDVFTCGPPEVESSENSFNFLEDFFTLSDFFLKHNIPFKENIKLPQADWCTAPPLCPRGRHGTDVQLNLRLLTWKVLHWFFGSSGSICSVEKKIYSTVRKVGPQKQTLSNFHHRRHRQAVSLPCVQAAGSASSEVRTPVSGGILRHTLDGLVDPESPPRGLLPRGPKPNLQGDVLTRRSVHLSWLLWLWRSSSWLFCLALAMLSVFTPTAWPPAWDPTPHSCYLLWNRSVPPGSK